jgi:hypothetical protein
MTVYQHASPAFNGILDKATCAREVDKNVLVFRVLHGYGEVVRTFRRKVLAHGQEVSNAKLSAEFDGLGRSKTGACVSMKMIQNSRAKWRAKR